MNRINTMTLKDPMHGDYDGITSAQIYAHFSQDAGGDLYRASEMHGASLRNKRPQCTRAVSLALFGLVAITELLDEEALRFAVSAANPALERVLRRGGHMRLQGASRCGIAHRVPGAPD